MALWGWHLILDEAEKTQSIRSCSFTMVVVSGEERSYRRLIMMGNGGRWGKGWHWGCMIPMEEREHDSTLIAGVLPCLA